MQLLCSTNSPRSADELDLEGITSFSRPGVFWVGCFISIKALGSEDKVFVEQLQWYRANDWLCRAQKSVTEYTRAFVKKR